MTDSSDVRLGQLGRPLLAVALLAVTTLSALAFTRLSLTNVDGEVYLGEGSYETEFVNMEWWWATFLLVIPIFFGAWAGVWTAPFAVVVSTAAVYHIADTNVERYVASGWADGLETGFGVLFVVVEAVLFLGAAVAGVGVRFLRAWLRRRRQPAPGWHLSPDPPSL